MPPNIGYVNQSEFSQRTLKASGRGRNSVWERIFFFNPSKSSGLRVATWENQVSDDGKPLDSFPVVSL